MNVLWRVGALCVAASTLGGCAIGGIAAFTPPGATPPVVEAPPPVAYGSFLEGPVGQKLSAVDRDKALAAEQDALASGQRRPWRGEHGTYGYVEPAAGGPAPVAAAEGAVPAAPGDSCRAFTSTIYIGGRAQIGHGRGCANPDGSFRITG